MRRDTGLDKGSGLNQRCGTGYFSCRHLIPLANIVVRHFLQYDQQEKWHKKSRINHAALVCYRVIPLNINVCCF